jgi:hypothetical protein
MRRKITKHDTTDEWDSAVQAFEQRLGGAKLADLENGDEHAFRIATRSLRKEAMKLMTADIERRDDECPKRERTIK